MKPTRATTNLADWMAAIGEPHRIDVLRELAKGSRNVTNLSQALGVEIANVSHHVRLLLGAKLVDCTKQGRFMVYRLAPGAEVLPGGVLRLRHAPSGATIDIPPETPTGG